MSTSLLTRCTFPPRGTSVVCALSGGADSTALVALAVEAGCDVEAVHVDHHLRPDSADDAEIARATAAVLGVRFRSSSIDVPGGPNLEARARTARRAVLGPAAMTGHTADDQAETVLLALLRGAGAAGLSAMAPGPTKPILALRRSETTELCDRLGLTVVHDPSNRDPRFRRNRVRHELLPLLNDIGERDVATLLARTSDLLRDDDELLTLLGAQLDVTDARALAAAPKPLARRAIRRWLDADGYPPSAAMVDRVLLVAGGDAVACEVSGGRRIERSGQRLRLFSTEASDR